MIRDFLEKDRDSLHTLAKEFYNSNAVSHPIPIENFTLCFEEILNKNPFVRGLSIVNEEDKAIGYVQLSFTYSSEAGGTVVLIEELYISKPYQNKGLATKTLNFIKDEYRASAKRIRLECEANNDLALSLYKKHGFSTLNYVQMIIE